MIVLVPSVGVKNGILRIHSHGCGVLDDGFVILLRGESFVAEPTVTCVNSSSGYREST